MIDIRILYVKNDLSQTAIAKPYWARIPVGYDDQIEVKSPAVEGFTPEQESVTLDFKTFTESKDLIVQYTPNTVSYTVEHLIENLDQMDYTSYQTDTKEAKVDDTVTAEPIAIEGFTAQDPPYESQPVPATGTLNLQVKYSRNVYTLSYNTDGGSFMASEQKLYESPLTEPAAPTKAGYTFAGWEPALPATMPAHDLELTAQWTSGEETMYRLAYWVQNPNDDGYTFYGYSQKSGKTGEIITIPEDGEGVANYRIFPLTNQKLAQTPEDFKRFFVYNKEKTESEASGKTIAADGSSVVKVYFDREIYSLLMGGQGEDYLSSDPRVWYPEIKRNGHVYKKPEILVVKARYGQDISKLLPKESEIANLEGRRIEGYFVDGKEDIVRFSQEAPCILYDIMCTLTQKTLREGEYADNPRALWITTLYSGTIANKLDVRIYYQDVTGQYPTDVQTQTFPLDESSWFYNYSVKEGFWPDASHMLRVLEYNANTQSYRDKPYYLFVIKRHGKPSLCVNDRILDHDGAILETITESYDRNADGEVDVYLKRRQYPLLIYASSQDAKALAQKKVYYEAEISSVLPDQASMSRQKPAGLPAEFVFKGWYADRSLTMPVGGMKMPARAQEAFAKWGPPEGEISVTIDADNSSETTTLSKSYGETVSKSELGTPEKAGFRFMGWYRLKADGSFAELYDFSERVRTPFTLKARWQQNKVEKLTVRFVDAEGKDVSPALTNDNLVIGSEYTYQAALVDKMLPDHVSKKITVDADPAKNVLTFTYAPFTTVDYKVRYIKRSQDAQGNVVEEDIQPSTEVTTEKNIDTRKYEPIQGYDPLTMQQTLQLSQAPEENVMTFVYRKTNEEAAYSIEYYFGQTEADGSYTYKLDKTQTKDASGIIGDRVTLSPTLMPENINEYKFNKEKSEISGLLVSDKTLVLHLYYDLPGKGGNVDTDGDGIPDNEDPDDDNDGVNDEDEKVAGLDPKKKDTDGDGVPDGEEDTDGDGIKNKDESDPNGKVPTDRDKDGKPDIITPNKPKPPVNPKPPVKPGDGDSGKPYNPYRPYYPNTPGWVVNPQQQQPGQMQLAPLGSSLVAPNKGAAGIADKAGSIPLVRIPRTGEKSRAPQQMAGLSVLALAAVALLLLRGKLKG